MRTLGAVRWRVHLRDESATQYFRVNQLAWASQRVKVTSSFFFRCRLPRMEGTRGVSFPPPFPVISNFSVCACVCVICAHSGLTVFFRRSH
jgi:hypothetical protein